MIVPHTEGTYEPPLTLISRCQCTIIDHSTIRMCFHIFGPDIVHLRPTSISWYLLYSKCRNCGNGLFVSSLSSEDYILQTIIYRILTCVADNVHARYFAVFCITSGTYTHSMSQLAFSVFQLSYAIHFPPAVGCILAWYVHNLGTETKKATGMPLFMAVGQCGSVLGSHLFPSTEGPRYLYVLKLRLNITCIN